MGGPFARFGDNDFRWWIARQLAAGDLAGVYDTLTLRDRTGTNAWYAAREARHETTAYAADLAAVVRAVDVAPASPDSVAQRAAYALLHQLLAEIATRVGPELASALVANQVWTLEQAFAWARDGGDAARSVLIIDELLQRDEGTLRDRLLAEIVAAGDRVVDESGPPLLARIAARADPHVQALLLEAIHAQADKGGRAMGLRDIVPVLDPALLNLAHDAALELSSFGSRIEVLTLIARARPLDQADAAYAELFALVAPGTGRSSPDVDDALTILARELPEDRLDGLDTVLNLMPADSRAALLAAATIEGRRLPVDEAMGLAATIDGSVADHDARTAIRVVVARRYADAGDADSALDALHLSATSPPGRLGDVWDALVYVVERAVDVENDRLLEALDVLEPDALIPLLRTLGVSVGGPAPDLRAFVSAREEWVRPSAMAAVAGCLEPTDIDGVLRSILGRQFIDADALADLAPRLDLGQAEHALRSVTSPDAFVFADAKLFGRLLTRIGTVAGIDRALEALTELQPSVRGDTLTPMLGAIPGHRLAGVLPEVMQPDPVGSARLGARTALSAALPSARLASLVDQAAALDQPLGCANALARLAALGQPAAQDMLPDALIAMGGEDLDQLALDLLLTGAARCPDLLPRLVDVVPVLDDAGIRALAYLNLARAERSTSADRAARLLIEELLDEPAIGLPIDAGWTDANDRRVTWPARPDPASLVAALKSTRAADHRALAVVVAELAPFLGDHGRLEIDEHIQGLDPFARMFARTALARLQPEIARHCRVAGLGAFGPCPERSDQLVVWLDYLDAAGLDPGPEIVGKAWASTLELDPRYVPGCVGHLVSLQLRPHEEMINRTVRAVLRFDDHHLDDAVVALAPALGTRDLRLVLEELRSRAEPPWRAVMAGADRAGLLGDDVLAATFFEDVGIDDWWSVSFASDYDDDDGHRVRSAVAHLSEQALRRLLERAPNESGLISLAVQGAVAGRHEALVRELVAGLPDGTTREELLDRVVPDAPLSWEPWLVPALRDAYGARALAAYAARHPPEHATELLTVALEVATPWDRRAILSNHHELAGAIPSDRLWDLWVRALGNTDSRRNVLGEIEAWAPVLIAAFGPAVAVALDDVITLLATDEWPTSRPG